MMTSKRLNNVSTSNNVKTKQTIYSRKVNVKYLISGYCRENAKSVTHITSSILDIILYFYPKMNGYKFIWNISPLSSYSYSSSTLTSLDSDPFDIGLSNNFFLRLQTIKTSKRNSNQQRQYQNNNYTFSWGSNYNNNNNNDDGIEVDDDDDDDTKEIKYNYILSVISFKLPPKFSYIIMHSELYCHEIDEEYSAIWELTNSTSTIQNGQNTYYDNRDNTNNAIKLMKMNWKIHENKENMERYLATKGLTFECKLNVLKIVADSSYITNKEELKKIQSYNHTAMEYDNYSKMRFIWNINDQYKIQKLINNGNGISYHSDVYYDLFQLKIGKKSSKICFFIQLCGLPKFCESIAVKWEIFAINEMDKVQNKIKIISQIITFSYNRGIYNFSNDQNEILSDILIKQKKLSLLCKANIIQRYDINGNAVDVDALLKAKKDETKNNIDLKDKKQHSSSTKQDNDTDIDDENKCKDKIITNINIDEIKQEITASKAKIFKPKKEDLFIWDIVDKLLLNKVKKLKRSNYLNSNIFTLFDDDKYKWYISIRSVNTNTNTNTNNNNTWSWGGSNNNDSDMIQIHVNSLCPINHLITCKIVIYLLELNKTYEYFQRFGNYVNNENRFQRQYLLCNQSELQKLDTMTIKIVMELVNVEIDSRVSIELKNDNDDELILNKEIKNWLCNVVKLPEYCDLFRLHGIDDVEVLKLLTIHDIKAMGINKVGHQIKLLSKIKLL